MSNPNTYEAILNRMRETTPASTKTAAEVAPAAPATDNLTSRMLETVQRISTKTAADTSDAVPALAKIAADVAATENQAFLAQAKLGGAAFLDGFLERLASVDAAASNLKVAAAAHAPAAPQSAIDQAFAAGVAYQQKVAQDEFVRGRDEMLQHVHKTAAEVHLDGQQSARNVLEALAAQADKGAS